MKKKLIAVFLVVATLLSCVFAFAACDKDKDKDKGGKNGGAGETYTEDEIAALMGKLATYVINKVADSHGIDFEVNEMTVADEDSPFLYNCEWSLISCIYMFKYNTVENATAAIEKIKNEFSQEFKNDGEFTVEQHGAILIVGGKNCIDEIMATEDKTVEILSREFINQYKANLKELLKNKEKVGLQKFEYNSYQKTFISAMFVDITGEPNKEIVKLVNDATAEEIKAFNEKYAKEGYQKINEKLYFFEDKS